MQCAVYFTAQFKIENLLYLTEQYIRTHHRGFDPN